MPVTKSLNRIPSSPVKINLEEDAPMKQGIVTILGSDCGSKAASIRRTLSADMSSKKWLEQNGFLSPMKKIVSSEALVLPADSSSSSSESEEDYEEIPNQDDVWRSIQAQKKSDQMKKPAQVEVWGSILTQKSENSLLPPPYVHPLVKRSSSTLSEKSLQVCTESLGSETGSDCFSSFNILSDGDEKREEKQRDIAEEFRDSNPFVNLHVAKYKKSPERPFPPPLPSIAGGGGAALRMHSHRENGRLVLEAVSVPPRNYFHAQRQDGRLLLTLIRSPATSSTRNGVEEFEELFDNMEQVDEEEMEADGDGDDDVEGEVETVEKEFEILMEQNLSLPSGMIRVHKSGLVMKKLINVGNVNPTWAKNIDKADQLITAEEFPIPQLLPPPSRVVTALIQPPLPPPATATFNVYEYFWRNRTTISGGFINPMNNNKNPNKIDGEKGYENQDLVLMRRSKTEQFVPYLRGCREARRSLLIWEPFCIATS